MNVNYAKLDNVSGEITVTLEEKDYADKVSKQLKEIGKKTRRAGFPSGSCACRAYCQEVWVGSEI